MLAAELYRRALEQAELVLARQFTERNHRTGEGDGADGCAEEQFQAVAGRDRVTQVFDDAQGLRLDHGGDRNEHRRQADHAVHERYQLRHLGHFYAFGHDGASGTADQQADNHIANASRCQLGPQLIDEADGGKDGQRHAEHAEQVAAPRSGWVRQALERLDEAD